MWRAEPVHRRLAPGGFSLVEVLLVLALLAMLTLLAWPSYQAQWLKARRGDAQLALMQLQQLQARWRADHPAYATAGELGAPALSPQGHYRLTVHTPSATGFALRAEAEGAQRADHPCAVMGLQQEHAHTRFLSQSATGAENPDPANRQCWSR